MSKRLEKAATTTCMKTLLMVFNFLFCITGVIMLCAGIWMRIELRQFTNMSMEGSGAALLVLACLGAVLAVATALACCCTARGHPALLYLYGAFLAVMALLELGVGASIYAYRTCLNKRFDESLNASMASYDQDTSSTNYIDFVQKTLQCCGSRGYADWFDVYPPKVPLSCCKKDTCEPNEEKQINTEGCYEVVLDFINSNIGTLASMSIGIAFFPLVGVFLACCLASSINKAEYEQVA